MELFFIVLFGNLHNPISFSFLSGNDDQLKMSPPTTEQIDEEARGAFLLVTYRNVIQVHRSTKFVWNLMLMHLLMLPTRILKPRWAQMAIAVTYL